MTDKKKLAKTILELYKPMALKAFRKDVANFKNVDSRDKSWSENLPDYFAKYGFRMLGSGKYASVFGNDKYPFVIKVFMKDAAFLKWMKFCVQNKSNPYCPKFRGGIIKITDNFFAIRIEKLRRYSGHFSLEDLRVMAKSDSNAQVVLAELERNSALLDIHGDNVMERPNGELVIIDPYYNWFKSGSYTIDPNDFDFKSLFRK